MNRLTHQGEWRLYLRDHKWWWKWPLIGGTAGVWLGAMVLFMAPWESSASNDDVETRPATTEPRSDDAPSGESEDVVDLTADTNTTALGSGVSASSIVGGADADVVESLTPEPPTETTPSLDDDERVTETTQSSRRPRTERTAAPESDPPPTPTLDPVPSPIGPDTFTLAPATPATTVRPTTTTATVQPTTTPTTVRPTTTTTTEPPPPTTEPPPPTTEPTAPPITEPPAPPVTEPPLPSIEFPLPWWPDVPLLPGL